MSKNTNAKMPGNMNYNRPSGGYQKNLYRQKLNAEGIKAPKQADPKKLRYIMIGGGIVLVLLLILLTVKFKWIGLLIGVVVAGAAIGGMYYYLNYKQKEIIKYYKKIGMTEEMYLNELKKRNVDKKQIDAMRRAWRKTKV